MSSDEETPTGPLPVPFDDVSVDDYEIQSSSLGLARGCRMCCEVLDTEPTSFSTKSSRRENESPECVRAILMEESLTEPRQRHPAATRQKNSPSSIRRRRRRRPPIPLPLPPFVSSLELCSSRRSRSSPTSPSQLTRFLCLVLALVSLAVTGCSGQQPGQIPPPNYSVYKMPDTNFDCRNKIVGGYYADAQAFCQMFHVCVQVGPNEVRDFRFLCPNDTVFDQKNFICANWWEVECVAPPVTSTTAASVSSTSPRPSPSPSSTTPIGFSSSTPSSVGAVGIKNKGSPSSTPGYEELPSKRPSGDKRPTVTQQELPQQQKPSSGQSSTKPSGQQPEYDYFYYEDLPPEYEYEYVDANGNVYPASALPPQQASSAKAPSAPSTTARPQQNQNTRFFNSKESFFPSNPTDKPSAFFFKASPTSQPSISPSLSSKGEAGQQQGKKPSRGQSGQHGLSSRPEAVEDFISTKVQQPSKESVAFVSSGKLTGDDSAGGFFSVREHSTRERQGSSQSNDKQASQNSRAKLDFFEDLPSSGEAAEDFERHQPNQRQNNNDSPKVHTYSEVNRPKSSYFVSTQLQLSQDGHSGRHSRVLNSPTPSGDQKSEDQPQVTVEEKVDSEVKDSYHHLVHHRDGDQGFRYHYQETPSKKTSGNHEDAAESATEASESQNSDVEHADLYGRSSSIGSPSKVGFESSAGDTSGVGEGQDFPDLFSATGESGLPQPSPSQSPKLQQSVSVSRSETQGPLFKLSSSRSSLDEEVKTGKRRSVASAIADGAVSQQKGIQTGLSVIVSRTSSSSQQRAAKVNVRPVVSNERDVTVTDDKSEATTTLRTSSGRSSDFFNEEEWKRVEDGVFGAKTIISVRKSVQSRA